MIICSMGAKMKSVTLAVIALVLGSSITKGTISKRSIADDVTFELFTQSNSGTYTTLAPVRGRSLGQFSVNSPTRFIIHGWVNSADDMASIKDDYLSAGDFNVILVDWSPISYGLYDVAKNSVTDVGAYVATLLDYLVETQGLDLSDVHIAGHSLGAHVAGVAGSKVTSGKVGKITGMDPALPLFEMDNLEDRLDPSDASFVEIIHTCGGTLGILDPIGHADFYPNGGIPPQPGCPLITLGACSHGRSHEFFSESIVSKVGFYAHKCDTYTEFLAGECNSNPQVLMGEYTDTSARGKYYLDTGSSPPYALGQ